ncbi:MAG: T9SS type A sorting domain-containing protein [candidate division WOR-3 bacterium]
MCMQSREFKIIWQVSCALFFFVGIGNAQLRWLGIYGGSGNDDAYCARQTNDNSYIAVGSTTSYGNGTQVYLLKIDSLGDTIWTKTYGGADWDMGYWVQQTSDSGYIIAGTTASFGEEYQAYLIKTDSLGDTLWTRTYGGPSYEFGWGVQQTMDGGYIIVGTTWNGGVYLIKTDANGDTLWAKTYGGDEGWSVQQTRDNGYIVAGYKNCGVYLIKTDSLGDTLWTRRYMDGIDDLGKHVEQTTDGGYIIVGASQRLMHLIQILAIKVDSLGNNPIYHCYGPNSLYSWSVGSCIQQTSDSGYILVGYGDIAGGEMQVYLIKTDSLLEVLWDNTFGGGEDDVANSVQQTSDGGYIIAGYSNSYGNGTQVYVIKTDSFGIGRIKDTCSSSLWLNTPNIYAYPNPFRNHCVIKFQIPSTKFQTNLQTDVGQGFSLAIKIYDATGRLVKQFNHLTIQPFNQVVWDGTDDFGRRLPAGIYFCHLEIGETVVATKVVELE